MDNFELMQKVGKKAMDLLHGNLVSDAVVWHLFSGRDKIVADVMDAGYTDDELVEFVKYYNSMTHDMRFSLETSSTYQNLIIIDLARAEKQEDDANNGLF